MFVKNHKNPDTTLHLCSIRQMKALCNCLDFFLNAVTYKPTHNVVGLVHFKYPDRKIKNFPIFKIKAKLSM